ncbi:unnamed protein product [Effrenium voratum]|nr:unnamed protein product [Effrenium voratum]
MLAESVSMVAYSNNPLCAPSRASMWSGRYASTSKAYSNSKALLCDVTRPNLAVDVCNSVRGYHGVCQELARAQRCPQNGTLNLILEHAGYNVKLFGKMDTGGGAAMNPPGTKGVGMHTEADWPRPPAYPSSVWGGYKPGNMLHSWAASSMVTKPEKIPYDDPSSSWVKTSSSEGSPHEDDWQTVESCVQFLASWKPGDAPFFLYCSVLNPHPPFWSNATYQSSLNTTALRALLARPVGARHPADQLQQQREGVPAWNATLAWELSTAYYGQVQETDLMVGRILKALGKLRDSTLTIFTSDHGELKLEHGHVEKMSHFEGSARVPLMVMGPSLSPRLTRAPVSLIDLFPTFLDFAGVERPAFLEGNSFRALLQGGPAASDIVLSEFMGESAFPNWMLRRGAWKLISYGPAFPPLLFDLEADPAEAQDLSRLRPDLVTELNALLNSRVNVAAALRELEQENKAHVRRWMDSYGSEDAWQQQFLHFYAGATAADALKLKEWLGDSRGPSSSEVALMV